MNRELHAPRYRGALKNLFSLVLGFRVVVAFDDARDTSGIPSGSYNVSLLLIVAVFAILCHGFIWGAYLRGLFEVLVCSIRCTAENDACLRKMAIYHSSIGCSPPFFALFFIKTRGASEGHCRRQSPA